MPYSAKLFLRSLLIVPALSLLSCLTVFAQVSESGPVVPEAGLRLVTSPLPISLVAQPGNTVSTELKVKNAGILPEQITIDTFKFKAFESSGAPQILDPEPGDDFIHWVQFSESTFLLDPEEWKTITATFTLPESASFGYYYAFVFRRVINEETNRPRETSVVGGTATLVLLEARVPDAERAITVTEFSTNRMVFEFLPVTFTVNLKNTGNVHVAPRGNIFVNQGKNKDIAVLDLNQGKGNILPNSARIFQTEWNDGFPIYAHRMEDGKVLHDAAGNPELQLTWNWEDTSKLRFGKYTAKMLLIYDDGMRDVPIEGVVSFWVIPWRLLGGALFIALFFLIGMKNSLMRLWRRFFPQKKGEQDTNLPE